MRSAGSADRLRAGPRTERATELRMATRRLAAVGPAPAVSANSDAHCVVCARLSCSPASRSYGGAEHGQRHGANADDGKADQRFEEDVAAGALLRAAGRRAEQVTWRIGSSKRTGTDWPR